MIRKFVLAAAAVAALGTASLAASTPAAAHFKGWHHHYHHGFYWRGGYGLYGVSYNSCLRRRWVVNRFGEPVLRVVNVCY